MCPLDKHAIVEEVRRLLPQTEIIALTGSAAHGGERFRPDSDIDVFAIHPRPCLAWSNFDGHEMAIGAMRKDGLDHLVQNPQWFTPGWIFRVGMIARAEFLFGPSLEAEIRSKITRDTWLVVTSGLIGLMLMAASKAGSGRRPHFHESIIDVPIVATALRRALSRELPIRCEPDADLAAKGPLSDFSAEFEGARTLAERYREKLQDNAAVAKSCSILPQRIGLEWMRRAAGIELPMPSVSS